MTELPTGTVTFLFTDIQGSTTLWEHHPESAHAALVRHDAIVETVIDRFGGALVRPRGEGDSRFAVFTRATDALAAAAALQQALQAEPWTTPTPLQVRMALHTGEADLRAGDYYGSAVNRCARLRAVAHGGQTLISQATFDLVRDAIAQELVPGVSLRDLGEHRLKDLIRAEHVHQVMVVGLPDAFPPLQSLDMHRHNLPLQRSPLLGREREVQAVTNLLLRADVGLVTLTGPGGTGKTRLSLQVAGELVGSFPDGVFFVDLAPISDPDLVLATIGRTLDIKEAPGQPMLETLTGALRNKRMLLVLDNFEQVVVAAPGVAGLLGAAVGLKVLVTSRFVLHLRGEHEYSVPPLALPNLQRLPPLERLTQYAAVQLFIQRAQAVKPDFAVTNANAPAVAEICVALDGLPLAIELAAARVKLFAPQALLHRLDNRLKLLTGGARDLAARQQTLRGAIDWSYDLLPPAEQSLFARLAVFVGGCSLEAAEAVCDAEGDLGMDVLDGLQALVDKSLVRQIEAGDGEPRFTMLETIRDYAREQLIAGGRLGRLEQDHAGFFTELAEVADKQMASAERGTRLQQLEQELANLRAVLGWFQRQSQRDGPGTAEGYVANLAWFWQARGYWQEQYTWLSWAANLPDHGGSPQTRSRLLRTAADAARWQQDLPSARRLLRASRRLSQEINDSAGIAEACLGQGRVEYSSGQWWDALPLFHESLTLFRALGDNTQIARVLCLLGEIALYLQHEVPHARNLLEEAWQRLQAVENTGVHGWVLQQLAEVALAEGDLDQARQRYEDSVRSHRAAMVKGSLATVLNGLGRVLVMLGDYPNAQSRLDEAFGLWQEMGREVGLVEVWAARGFLHCTRHQWKDASDAYRHGLAIVAADEPSLANITLGAMCMEGLAQTLAAQDRVEEAARLWGATAAYRELSKVPREVVDQPMYDRDLAAARARLGDVAFETAWREGQAMTWEAALARALGQAVVQ